MSQQLIAQRYARALYNQASAAKQTDEVLQALRSIRRLEAEVPALRELLGNPLLTYDESVAALRAAFLNKVPESVINFLEFITSKRRLRLLPQMADEFATIYNEAHNQIVMKVVSAFPLNESIKKALTDKVAKLSGQKVVGEYHIDRSIIGGVRVWAAGKLYEYSFNNELQDYKRKALQNV